MDVERSDPCILSVADSVDGKTHRVIIRTAAVRHTQFVLSLLPFPHIFGTIGLASDLYSEYQDTAKFQACTRNDHAKPYCAHTIIIHRRSSLDVPFRLRRTFRRRSSLMSSPAVNFGTSKARHSELTYWSTRCTNLRWAFSL